MNFRCWPHIYKDAGRSKLFYGKIERTLPEDLALLRTYDNREDRVEYTAILKQVLHKFGNDPPFSRHVLLSFIV
jgi:hypothetical protein